MTMFEMAVSAREGSDPLYRSVSPWELEDIIRTGHVVGKGSFFSGDRKRTNGRVWFGATLAGVAHHGTDWQRYLESTDTFQRAFKLKEEINALRNSMDPPWNMPQADRWNWPDWKHAFAMKLSKLFSSYQDALFKRLGDLQRQAEKFQEKQPAAYVIEVDGVTGGTRYSGKDSLAGKGFGTEERPDEIAMPEVRTHDIVRIYGMDKAGHTLQTWDRPSGGWSLSMFNVKKRGAVVVAPDVSKGLAAMDKATSDTQRKFDEIRKSMKEGVVGQVPVGLFVSKPETAPLPTTNIPEDVAAQLAALAEHVGEDGFVDMLTLDEATHYLLPTTDPTVRAHLTGGGLSVGDVVRIKGYRKPFVVLRPPGGTFHTKAYVIPLTGDKPRDWIAADLMTVDGSAHLRTLPQAQKDRIASAAAVMGVGMDVMKPLMESGAKQPAFDVTGDALGKLYHAGLKQVKKIDPAKRGKRDEGWYGAGFYVSEDPDYVREWYGPVVSEFSVSNDAKVLRASIDASKAPDGLFDAVMENEKTLLAARGNEHKIGDIEHSLRENQIEWVHAVDRFAEASGYDVVWFSPHEIVVKNPKAVKALSESAATALQEASNWRAHLVESALPKIPDDIAQMDAFKLGFRVMDELKAKKHDPYEARAWAEAGMRQFGWKGERTVTAKHDGRVNAFLNVWNEANKAVSTIERKLSRQATAKAQAASGEWKVGDKVMQKVAGPFGMPASIHGEVVKGTGGVLRVKITGSNSMMGNLAHVGQTYPLGSEWKKLHEGDYTDMLRAQNKARKRRKKMSEAESLVGKQWTKIPRTALMKAVKRGLHVAGDDVPDHMERLEWMLTRTQKHDTAQDDPDLEEKGTWRLTEFMRRADNYGTGHGKMDPLGHHLYPSLKAALEAMDWQVKNRGVWYDKKANRDNPPLRTGSPHAVVLAVEGVNERLAALLTEGRRAWSPEVVSAIESMYGVTLSEAVPRWTTDQLALMDMLLSSREYSYDTTGKLAGVLGWPESKVKTVVEQLRKREVLRSGGGAPNGGWYVEVRDANLWTKWLRHGKRPPATEATAPKPSPGAKRGTKMQSIAAKAAEKQKGEDERHRLAQAKIRQGTTDAQRAALTTTNESLLIESLTAEERRALDIMSQRRGAGDEFWTEHRRQIKSAEFSRAFEAWGGWDGREETRWEAWTRYLFEQQAVEREHAAFLAWADRIDEGVLDKLHELPRLIRERIKFIVDLAKQAVVKLSDLVEMFKNAFVWKFFNAVQWSMSKLFEIVRDGFRGYHAIINAVAEYAASTPIGIWTEAELVKLDAWLEKHPKVKAVGGPAIAGVLLFMWLAMPYIGDPDYDFDQSSVIDAALGRFSLHDLFGGRDGAKLLLLFVMGLFLDVSFPWPGEHAHHFAVGLVGAVAKKVHKQVRHARDPIEERVLVEAAKAIHDLPEKVQIRVHHEMANSIQIMYWFPSGKRKARKGTESVEGMLMLSRGGHGPCDKAWMVEWAEALSGWGPLLYDVAVEVSTKLGGGLMADRRSVSDEAHRVWMYYMKNRSDVKVHQLDNIESPHLTGRPDDDCEQTSAVNRAYHDGEKFDDKGRLPWTKTPESKRITKDNPTTIRALAAAGKLALDGLDGAAIGVHAS